MVGSCPRNAIQSCKLSIEETSLQHLAPERQLSCKRSLILFSVKLIQNISFAFYFRVFHARQLLYYNTMHTKFSFNFIRIEGQRLNESFMCMKSRVTSVRKFSAKRYILDLR